MATALRLRYLIIVIGVNLYTEFSHGFLCEFHELPYRGVQIVKQGEPCPTSYYLPVRIEEPVQSVEEKSARLSSYQPLKLSYQTFKPLPQPQYLHQEYPVSVEMPKPPPPETTCTTVSFPTKSYEYKIQIPPPPTERIPISYNFDLQVLPPKPTVATAASESPKFITGLTSRIDKIVIPACDEPLCNCNIYEDHYDPVQ